MRKQKIKLAPIIDIDTPWEPAIVFGRHIVMGEKGEVAEIKGRHADIVSRLLVASPALFLLLEELVADARLTKKHYEKATALLQHTLPLDVRKNVHIFGVDLDDYPTVEEAELWDM